MTSALAGSNAERPIELDPNAALPGDTLAPPESGAPLSMSEPLAPRESGLAPRLRHSSESTFCAEADEHVQLALAESVHAEANLNLMMRNAQQLCAGLGTAGEALIALGRELDAARELLAHGNAEQRALRSRVRMLQEALECARGDADRERALFIEQEDAFLRSLLDDHAREVSALEQRLARALELPPPATGFEENDPFPSAPPLPSAASESGSQRLGSVRLRTVYVPKDELLAPDAGDTVPAPPQEEPSAPPPRSSQPVLRPKPPASTRPLIEYTLGGDEVAEEHLGPSRSAIRPKMP